MAHNLEPERSLTSLQPGIGRSKGLATTTEASETEGRDARKSLAVLRRQLWLIILIASATIAPIAFLTLREPPEYRATGMIRLVDSRQGMTRDLDGMIARPLGARSDPLLSQIEVLSGREVLGDVVDREFLRLRPSEGLSRGDLEVLEVWAEAADTLRLSFWEDRFEVRTGMDRATASYGIPVTLGGVTFTIRSRPASDEGLLTIASRDAAIDRLARRLVAAPVDRTDVIRVSYTARDRQSAQGVVNAAIEAFQAADARRARQESERRRAFLEEQLRQADSMLVEAQQALGSVRARERAYSSQELMMAQQNALMNLDMRREELRADRRMYEELLSGIQEERSAERSRALRTVVSAPGIAENAVVSRLFAQLLEYQAEHARLTSGSAGSTPNHPEVQRFSALIGSTEAELIDAVRSHIASLDARVTALDALRSRTSGELARLPQREAEEVRLVQQAQTMQRVADQVQQDLHRARMAEAVETGNVEIVYLAPVPEEPVRSGKAMRLGMGMVLGLLLGIGGAFVRESLFASVRRQEEVETLLRVPGLAIIPGPELKHRGLLPNLRTDGGAAARKPLELVTVSNAESAGAEAYRMLRTNLMFSQSEGRLRVIAVTSAAPGDGKTTTAANLAVVAAQNGSRVLLADCDLRRGNIHRIFRIERSPGIRDLMRLEVSTNQVVRPTQVEGLSVLTCGSTSENGAQGLSAGGLKDLLNRVADSYDLVILDTPPVLSAADALILSLLADGVLFVVRAGTTDRESAKNAMRHLSHLGARVIGTVLNDPDMVVPGYLEYYEAYASSER